MSVDLRPLVGKQSNSAHLATARTNVWEGSVRSSKTVTSLIRWLQYVRTGPRGNLLMVGKTERTLKRNVIGPLIDMLGPKRCRYIAGEGELHLMGRRIYVAGANDEKAQDKIRGLTLAGAYVDEASTVPESFWTMLTSRLSVRGAQLFATTNPDAPAHWLKKKWLDRASVHLTGDGRVVRHGGDRLNLARFSFRLDDNPHLPPEYVADISREYVGLWYRRYIAGEWVVAEGAIYSMFDPGVHVVDGLSDDERVIRWLGVGLDYGTANPFAAVRLALTTKARLYVAGEWRHDSTAARRQMTDAEYARAVANWLDDRPDRDRPDPRALDVGWLCVDPSAASFKVQLHRDGFRSVTDADNDVLDGIRRVASLLGNGQLVIDRSCTGLLDELPGYSWDDKAAEKGEDKPLKVDDHSCDALRYAISTTEPLWATHLRRTT